jgi:hypothetical protein
MEQDGDSNPPLSEPEIVPCPYLTGADIMIERGVMQFIGWQDLEGERRIRVRYAISTEIARELNAKFRRLLPRGH